MEGRTQFLGIKAFPLRNISCLHETGITVTHEGGILAQIFTRDTWLKQHISSSAPLHPKRACYALRPRMWLRATYLCCAVSALNGAP